MEKTKSRRRPRIADTAWRWIVRARPDMAQRPFVRRARRAPFYDLTPRRSSYLDRLIRNRAA